MQWKPASISHVASIIALMIAVLGINGITFYYMHTLSTTQFFFLQLTNITFGIGMSYYAVNFALNEQGMTVTTTPEQSK
jgi:hypothetical protein